MKTSINGKKTGVFLILTAAVLWAGCANNENPANSGEDGRVGAVRVILEGDPAPGLSMQSGSSELSVQAASPGLPLLTVLPGLTFHHYTYSFQQNGGTAAAQEPVGGVFTLGIGSGWTVTVFAYAAAGPETLAATGTSAAFTVSAGTNTTTVPVSLTPVVGEGTGTLTVSISYPGTGVTLDSFTLTPYGAGGTAINLKAGHTNGAAQTRDTVGAGYYLLAAALTDSAGYKAGKTEAVHIYKNAVTTVSWFFQSEDFTSDLGASPFPVTLWSDDNTALATADRIILNKTFSDAATITALAGTGGHRWTVNGSPVPAAAGVTDGGTKYTFSSVGRENGTYTVGLAAVKNGKPYSGSITLRVGEPDTAAEMKAFLTAYLSRATGGDSPANPVVVKLNVTSLSLLTDGSGGSSDGIGVLFTANTAGKYVSYDLSGSTLTTISGNSRGSNADKLVSVTLPNTLTSIGNFVFNGCSGLTAVTIPSSVASIGNYAFHDCSGLISVTIPDSVISIGAQAFYGCSGLTSVTIPDSVTSIGGSAFRDCIGLTSITIPNSVTTISDRVFGDCSGLTSVTIPDSVTSIENNAFISCSGLTSVTIPDSVTIIGSFAFYGCSRLTSVTIGNSVASIGNYAFYGCSSLTSVTIPGSVTSIGTEAFYGCSDLISVTIPGSVASIGNRAFSGCSGLTSLTVGNGVTSIGSSAFYGCNGLTSVTIPGSVTSIGSHAFYDCYNLTSIMVDSGNLNYKDINGVLFNKAGTTLLKCPALKTGAYTIPNGVTSIEDNAFRSCRVLTAVTIPGSVTSIGTEAFYGCSDLTSVTIPLSVTSIGDYAFSQCNGLTAVYVLRAAMPLTTLGSYAFQSSYSVQVIVPASVEGDYEGMSGWSAYAGRIQPAP